MADRIRVLELPHGLDEVFPVVKELRKELELGEFKNLVMLANAADGYRVVVIEKNAEIIGMMGYRILHDLVDGSHLYVDDLVVSKTVRSKGHGAALLKFAEAECRRLGFSVLRLCARLENVEGQKFYEREGWDKRSYSYKRIVPSH